MHPVTLCFSDEVMEQEYQLKRFHDSYIIVAWFCGIFSVLMVVRAVAYPPAFMGSSIAAALGMLLLLSRAWLECRCSNQHLARMCFAWGSTCAIVIAVVGHTAVLVHRKRRDPELEPMSASAVYVLALLTFLFALYFKLIAVLHVQRLMVHFSLAVGTPIIALFASPFSDLGPLIEAIIIGSALLLGEVCGHPLEWAYRTEYLKHGVARKLAFHPITLRLLSDDDEREYRIRRFTSSYRSVPIIASILIPLVILNALANPIMIPHSCGLVTVGLGLVLLRMRLHRMVDQHRAAQIFSWVAVCALTAIYVRNALWSSPAKAGELLSTPAVTCTILIRGLIFQFWRYLGIMAPQRLLGILTIAIYFGLFAPAVSVLGRKDERLLQLSATLLTWLLGQTLEVIWLHMHVAARRQGAEYALQEATAEVSNLNRLQLASIERAYGGKSKVGLSQPAGIAVPAESTPSIAAIPSETPFDGSVTLSSECFRAHYAAQLYVALLALVLICVHTAARSQLTPSGLTHSALLITIIAARYRVHRMADHQKAHRIFSWVLAILIVIRCSLPWVASPTSLSLNRMAGALGIYLGLSANDAAQMHFVAVICSNILLAIAAVHLRLTMQHAPRLISLGAVTLQNVARERQVSPFQEGQVEEAKLVVAALMLGELIGHVLEDAASHMAAEARRVLVRGQQAAKRHAALVEVVRMLFPQGSLIAAGLVTDLVKPEIIAGMITPSTDSTPTPHLFASSNER